MNVQSAEIGNEGTQAKTEYTMPQIEVNTINTITAILKAFGFVLSEPGWSFISRRYWNKMDSLIAAIDML